MDAANDNEKLPRTRAEAIEVGEKHYFTGEACKYGHVEWRYTADGRCAECSRLKALERYYQDWEANKAQKREYMVRKYAEDPEFRQNAKAKQKEPKVLEKKRARERKKRKSRTDEEIIAVRTYMREYQRKRCEKSPKARLNRAVSGGIYKSLVDGAKAGRKWEGLVGYTIDDLVRRLERLFQPGMTWENYGKWHIDHETPKSAFNYETPEDIDFKRCWALSNLRPMWARDNIIKGNTLSKPFQPSLLIATNDNKQTPQKETNIG